MNKKVKTIIGIIIVYLIGIGCVFALVGRNEQLDKKIATQENCYQCESN